MKIIDERELQKNNIKKKPDRDRKEQGQQKLY